jgi:hypothetical protein
LRSEIEWRLDSGTEAEKLEALVEAGIIEGGYLAYTSHNLSGITKRITHLLLPEIRSLKRRLSASILLATLSAKEYSFGRRCQPMVVLVLCCAAGERGGERGEDDRTR